MGEKELERSRAEQKAKAEVEEPTKSPEDPKDSKASNDEEKRSTAISI